MLGQSPKVSAVLVTFNNEAGIVRALDSVSWCDEVLIVDSGSSDRTLAICEERGCKILHREFTGYGEQKAFAVSKAAHDWVLSIDPDEHVSEALREEILAKLGAPNVCRGYYIPVTTVLWDQVVRLRPRHTAWELRLFDRRYGSFRKRFVHESVRLEGPKGRLSQPICNYPYRGVADYFQKLQAYSGAAAYEAFLLGAPSHVLLASLAFPFRFVWSCLIKGFICDGSVGVAFSFCSALYPVMQQFKLRELLRSEAAQTAGSEGLRPQNVESAESLTVPVAAVGQARFVSQLPSYVFALCSLALATFVCGLFRDPPAIDYYLLSLAAVVASARFWGFGPALVAMIAALLSLDYFALPPDGFNMPDAAGLIQLSLFAGLSLLSTALIYSGRRRSAR